MVLTGYNTDIEHDGMTYHVQTEDKGRSNPHIESLVYAHGEILYSKRTPYHDLVAQEVDAKAIATLIERQHRTIVEAIRRGRIGQIVGASGSAPAKKKAVDESGDNASSSAGTRAVEPSLDEVILDYLKAQRGRAHLILTSTGTQDFVYGKTTDVRIMAVDSHDNSPQSAVTVTVLFKSTAEPRRLQLAEGQTDDEGFFAATAALPEFNGGTSAVVVTAVSELGQSEIKHLVHR